MSLPVSLERNDNNAPPGAIFFKTLQEEYATFPQSSPAPACEYLLSEIEQIPLNYKKRAPKDCPHWLSLSCGKSWREKVQLRFRR